MDYFLRMQGHVIGPMTASQVAAYDINPNTQVSTDGTYWQPLYDFPELMQQYSYKQQNAGTDSKKMLCGLMAIFFGTLGVQYFVLGRIGAGFITILLSIVTCGLWEIVAIIQGIMILCMSNAEFEAKYVNNRDTYPLF